MDQIMPILQSVLTDDKIGLSLKITLLVLGLSIFIYWKKNAKRWQVDSARNTEQAKEVADKTEMKDNNIIKNEQVKSDSKKIDDFLKEEK
jgi:hypothetical protein